MYDEAMMNPSLYSQFNGGGGMYGNMPMSSPQIQQGLGNQPNMSQMGMGGQMPSSFMQPQNPQNSMNMMEEQKRRQEAFKMMAQGVQGMGRGQQQGIQQPTQQILRDQNQFRFAGNPQQQMAQALRNRGQ